MQPVLKADLGDGIIQVFMKRSIDTAGICRQRGVPQSKRSLSASAVSCDPDGTLPAQEPLIDPFQFSLPALENPSAAGRPGDGCYFRKAFQPRLPFLHLQDLNILRQKTAQALTAVAQKGGKHKPGKGHSQRAVRALLFASFAVLVKRGQQRADVAIDCIPVRRIHLRHKALFLLRPVLQKPFNLIAQVFLVFFTVETAVFLHDQYICFENAAHGGRCFNRPFSGLSLNQHPVKPCPLRSDRIPFFFTAEQKTAALGVRLYIVHQGIPAAEMQKEKMVHLHIGTAMFCQDLRHISQTFLGKTLLRMIPRGHGKIGG